MTTDDKLWNKNASGFVKKPGKGWLHSDTSIQDGITYNVKYIGCIGINESMKSLSFEVRTQVARESIRRVAESAKLLILPRKNRKNDEHIMRILSSNCITQWSGMNVELHINTQYLKVTQAECKDTLFQHTMQNISFACGGDTDIQDFVAYVAKDDVNGRACYVFECFDGSANSVITTVGQAFELRFRKFLSSMPSMKADKSISPTAVNVSDQQPQHNHQEQHGLNNNKQINRNVNNTTTNNNSHNLINTTNNLNNHHTNNGSNLKEQLHHHQNHVGNNNTNTSSNGNSNGTNGSSKKEERLDKMLWFHGLLTRENAEKLLVKDGDFLVRETNKAEKQYVLSGRYKGECRHIFLVDPSGVVRTKDRVFDNISHLIQYHQDNNIPIISKENELLLEHPVCKLN